MVAVPIDVAFGKKSNNGVLGDALPKNKKTLLALKCPSNIEEADAASQMIGLAILNEYLYV